MRKIIAIAITSLAVCACSSIDCPLNNTVYTTYKLTGKVDTLKDTLTVSTMRDNGTDTIVLNKSVKTLTFSLPISYAQDKDVFFLQVKDTNKNIIYDTIRVNKTNQPHFESVDCTPSYFHTITGISYTRNKIDSIAINNNEVNYDTSKEHFHIYFKSGN
jgi:hypothetical protein